MVPFSFIYKTHYSVQSPRLKSSWTAPKERLWKEKVSCVRFCVFFVRPIQKILPVLMRGRSGAKLHHWMRSLPPPLRMAHTCSDNGKAIRSRRSSATRKTQVRLWIFHRVTQIESKTSSGTRKNSHSTWRSGKEKEKARLVREIPAAAPLRVVLSPPPPLSV